MRGLEKGLLQIYCGECKGKTTAALGLAMRAVGQGLKVYFLQFLKPRSAPSGEVNAARFLEGYLKLERVNDDSFIGPISPDLHRKNKELLTRKLNDLKSVVRQDLYDLIVLDEILNALGLDLVSEEDLRELLRLRDPRTELVLTGRRAPRWLIEEADLVTEMTKIKHPYDRGMGARKGIEY